jgi:hypothetical protein
MQDELNQFEINDVWELVLRPKNQSIIGTKWVFRNKVNEHGIIVRNKARLVVIIKKKILIMKKPLHLWLN